MSVSAIPRENRTNEMCIEIGNERKYIKKHPQHYRLWLEEELTDFNNFWCKHFWHHLPLNDYSSFYLTKCLFLHYLENLNWRNRIKMQYFVEFVSPGSAEADIKLMFLSGTELVSATLVTHLMYFSYEIYVACWCKSWVHSVSSTEVAWWNEHVTV